MQLATPSFTPVFQTTASKVVKSKKDYKRKQKHKGIYDESSN